MERCVEVDGRRHLLSDITKRLDSLTCNELRQVSDVLDQFHIEWTICSGSVAKGGVALEKFDGGLYCEDGFDYLRFEKGDRLWLWEPPHPEDERGWAHANAARMPHGLEAAERQ